MYLDWFLLKQQKGTSYVLAPLILITLFDSSLADMIDVMLSALVYSLRSACSSGVTVPDPSEATEVKVEVCFLGLF